MKNVQKATAKNCALVVAVVGSRSVTECPALLARLVELAPDQVVSGGAAGADTLGAEWARANGVPLRVLRPGCAPCAERGHSGGGQRGAGGVGREKPGHAERCPRRCSPGPALRVAGGPCA